MAYAELKSDITIGTWQFSGVHEVVIKKGLHGYNDSATIRIPARAVVSGNGFTDVVLTSNLFNDRDAVSIKLGYSMDGKPAEMVTEFEGFVKQRNAGMPIEIECEGYSQQLRLDVSFNKKYTSTTGKTILLDMLSLTPDIKLIMPVDFPVTGVSFTNATGDQVIDHLKKITEGALSFFFLYPSTLWVGLIYTPTIEGSNVFGLPKVGLRLGFNVIRDNGLKEKTPSEPVQTFVNGQLVSGDVARTESKEKTAQRKVKYFLNNVPSASSLQSFAQEKAYQMNYRGYEGYVTAFLQPFCSPGYSANIVDSNYPERTGLYIIESTEVRFGVSGARRKIAIGPRIN